MSPPVDITSSYDEISIPQVEYMCMERATHFEGMKFKSAPGLGAKLTDDSIFKEHTIRHSYQSAKVKWGTDGEKIPSVYSTSSVVLPARNFEISIKFIGFLETENNKYPIMATVVDRNVWNVFYEPPPRYTPVSRR